MVGGAWTCTPASAADTLSGLGCAEGEIPAFVGGVWTCATNTDANTTYAAGTGITISGANNTIDVDTSAVQARVGGSCAAGLSIRQINADGTVICEADDDTNTTYAAGAGITISGATNDIAVNTATIQARVSGSCAANESIRQINVDGTVVCEADTDTDTDTLYTAAAGGGLVLGAGNAFGINNDAITSARILDGAVGPLDLANNAVTTAKIADANVTTAKIADANVTTLKLADNAVTTAKIADANVTTLKLADNAVTSAKIAANTIVAADIDNTSVQQRVAGTCAPGNAISAIAANGTVTCEPDDNTVYTDAQAIATRNLIVQRTLTPRWLNTNATFGTRPRTLAANGSRLDIGVGGTGDKILEVPLAGAGRLSNTETYTVRIGAWVEHLTADNDLYIGLSDGTDVVSFLRGDSANAVVGWLYEGTDGATFGSQVLFATSGATGNNFRWVEIVFVLDARTFAIARGEGNIPHAAAEATRVIDRAAALKLVMFANDPTEQYGIHLLEVSITEND